MKKILLLIFLLTLVLLLPYPAWVQEDEDPEPPLQLKKPLEMDQMEEYRAIPFTVEGFERISSGMTEREVLSTLGKPEDAKVEHRRHNRWTVHYFYHDGYVVNFRNGLVVGKEKSQ